MQGAVASNNTPKGTEPAGVAAAGTGGAPGDVDYYNPNTNMRTTQDHALQVMAACLSYHMVSRLHRPRLPAVSKVTGFNHCYCTSAVNNGSGTRVACDYSRASTPPPVVQLGRVISSPPSEVCAAQTKLSNTVVEDRLCSQHALVPWTEALDTLPWTLCIAS